MLALFLIDWIVDYINTPELQQTPMQGILFVLAIGIFVFSILGLCILIYLVYDYIKGRWHK